MALGADFAARVAAAAEEMRRKATEKETIRTETLPPEIRIVIDQLRATVVDHEKRLVGVETFQAALIREAVTKMKGAA